MTSIYFHFNPSQFSFEQSCSFPHNSVLTLDFDTVIFYHIHAMFNNLISTLLQGELTQTLQRELFFKYLELFDKETTV